jgi:4-nitrophenyl phosphatase
MLHAALAGVEVDLADCMMVGDRLSTDIRMGLDTGMAAALVLTGETSADDLQDLSPDDTPPIVVDRIDRLLPPEVWAETGWTEDERV